MLKLNSIPASVFEAAEISNEQVKLNSAKGGTLEVSRRDIIATGRLVACEFIGGLLNKGKGVLEKYNSRIQGANFTYADLAQKHKEKKLLYCATKVCAMTGVEPPETFEDFKKMSLNFAQDKDFLKVLAAIDREILSPIFFDVMDAVAMNLMQWEAVPFGGTKEITVRSNDVFLWEDGSWGSGRSTSKNYLYSKTVTLNPTMRSCNFTIKWYQDVVSGDPGAYYAALMLGLYNKEYAILISNLDKAVAGGKYIPAGLTASTYTSANWLRITDLVAAANGVRVDNLMAIGTRSALSNILPMDGEGGALLGLMYGLGEQWFTNGYLPNVGGVDLFPVSPVIVPGTQNKELVTIDTGNSIYILAKGLYKPMYGAYLEGSPMTLTATPGGTSGAYGTADFTIDVNAGATFDIKPVFASKVGVVTSVYPT